MSILGVNSVLAGVSQYANRTQKTSINKTGFKEQLQKTGEAADMVVPYPPDYSRFTYDSSISNKSKEEMTMDEYKQWVMNEMSQMPL